MEVVEPLVPACWHKGAVSVLEAVAVALLDHLALHHRHRHRYHHGIDRRLDLITLAVDLITEEVPRIRRMESTRQTF